MPPPTPVEGREASAHGAIAILVARALIAAMLVGTPALLITIAGNPLPTVDQVGSVLRFEPDWGDAVLLRSLLPCAAWVAWSLFAYPLIGELFHHWSGRRLLPALGALRLQQHLAATLVATALVSGSGAAHAERAEQHTSTAATPSPRSRHTSPAVAVPTSTEADDPRSDRPPASSYRVREGDTLWAIADRKLGSGAEYPKIVGASRTLTQAGGRHLTDPDLILPGWRLAIPATAPSGPTATTAPPHPAPTTRPNPERSPQPSTASPSSAPSSNPAHEGESVERSPAGGAKPPEAEAPEARVIGGAVAGLLAAGLLASLAARRRRQRSRRGSGERLPVPVSGPVAELESQLRDVVDPVALQDLRRALALVGEDAQRTGSPLPELFAVRIDGVEITLYLSRPSRLSAPYWSLFDDDTVWALSRESLSESDRPLSAAPYPALVTVGTDLDGGALLIDLEQQTQLAVTAPPDSDLARGMLNAIVAELATVPWGEDIHLSLVDVPEQLALELDPYRIHRVGDVWTLCRDLRTHLADRRRALDARGIPDIRSARLLAHEVEAWAPFVVVIGSGPSDRELEKIDDLVREHAATGLVVVQQRYETRGASVIGLEGGGARFKSALLDVPPLPFSPQLVGDQTLEGVLRLFQVAAAPPTPAPAARIGIDEPRVSGVEQGLEIESEEGEPASARAPHDGPSSREGGRDATASDSTAAPYLRILGQISIERVDRGDLMPGRGAEFLVYLLHHRQPVPGAQIQKALWPNSYDRSNNNARTLAKQVRSALGHDPDGHLWLPEGRGPTGFTLHPGIRSDWSDFVALVGPDPHNAEVDRLAEALRLVQGQALLGSDGHRGRWAWRSPLEEAIIAGVLDASEALADRALGRGDTSLTRLAARAARFVDPLSEISYRIELRAAHVRRSAGDLERTVNDLYATLGQGEPDYEPDVETLELIQRVRVDLARSRP